MDHCAHEGCDCPVPTERANRGDKFCSEFCSQKTPSQAQGRDDCGCGHPSCHHHGS
ncbi:MAG TPA: metallothionein [Polyangia bacterium]|nr:metallothionein [Polyangia bacterium]